MSTRFTFQIYLPTQEKYHRFQTFDSCSHVALAKYIQNNDDSMVVDTFKYIIKTSCIDDIDVESISIIDIFCILLNLRIMSISQLYEYDGVTQTDKERIKQTQKLDLYDVLDLVTNFETEYITRIDTNLGYSVSLKTPRHLMIESVEDLVIDMLDTIEIEGKQYNLSKLSCSQKESILDSLPGDLLPEIISYIKLMDAKYRIKVFKNTADTELNSIELKLFDNSMYNFLKAMFNCNLQEQYYIRYLMVKQLRFTLSDVENLSPIDTQNYINLFREELEEQRKAQEKQSGEPKTSMALPSPG